MSYFLTKYKKGDFKSISWEEYGKTLEKLYKKVDSYVKNKRLRIDAVVPILRGGATPGAYLAFKLNLLRILPVQYKYFFDKKKIVLRRLLAIPRMRFKSKL